MRGEPRFVHFRRSRCWFPPVTRVCPAAISSRAPHHRRVAPSVHSEDQRARVEGPSEGRVPIRMQRCPVRASGSYAYGGVRRRRSPPGLPSDIRCHRRARYPRRNPLVPITSRPRPSFQRHTAKRAAFQKTGMPVAATTRKGFVFSEFFVAEGLLLLRPHAGSLAHATHTLSTSLWKVLLLGLASVTVRSPAIRDGSSSQLVREYRRLCYPHVHAWD